MILTFDVFRSRPGGHARCIPTGYTLCFVRKHHGAHVATYGITSRCTWFDAGADDCMVILDEVEFIPRDEGSFYYRKTGRTRCVWTSTYLGSWSAPEAP